MKNEEVYQFGGAGLHAFYNYPRATAHQKAQVCNGAGPRRFGFLVPDTFCGLCITESAHNHDWDFQFGETIEDFDQANRTFRNNMIRQAEALRKREQAGAGWAARKWSEYKHGRRLEMIEEYYKAVCAFGGPAFWDKEAIGFSWTDIPLKEVA